jgi:hypothetical protein
VLWGSENKWGGKGNKVEVKENPNMVNQNNQRIPTPGISNNQWSSNVNMNFSSNVSDMRFGNEESKFKYG